MKKLAHRLIAGMLLLAFFSCKKNNVPAQDCVPGGVISREIVNKAARVQLLNGKFYLVEAGTIDQKLLPCNLDAAFRQNGLLVTISGQEKGDATAQNEPCCTSYFWISKISRQ